MSDKMLTKMINDNHNRIIEKDKKVNKKRKIKNIILVILLFSCLLLMINYLRKNTLKVTEICMSQGYEYNYCLKEAQ